MRCGRALTAGMGGNGGGAAVGATDIARAADGSFAITPTGQTTVFCAVV